MWPVETAVVRILQPGQPEVHVSLCARNQSFHEWSKLPYFANCIELNVNIAWNWGSFVVMGVLLSQVLKVLKFDSSVTVCGVCMTRPTIWGFSLTDSCPLWSQASSNFSVGGRKRFTDGAAGVCIKLCGILWYVLNISGLLILKYFYFLTAFACLDITVLVDWVQKNKCFLLTASTPEGLQAKLDAINTKSSCNIKSNNANFYAGWLTCFYAWWVTLIVNPRTSSNTDTAAEGHKLRHLFVTNDWIVQHIFIAI